MVYGRYDKLVRGLKTTAVDACEILHLLLDGKHPMILDGCQPSFCARFRRHPQSGDTMMEI